MRFAVALVAMAVGATAQPFGAWYGEALRGNTIADMTTAGAAGLERALAANPEDFPARLKLMAYHHRADRASLPAERAKLVQHTMWLIEHHPESDLLRSFVSRMEKWPAPEYARAVALWDAAMKAHPNDALLQWNAANFFSGVDGPRYLRALEASAAADPEQSPALRALAHFYAYELLRPGPLRAQAQAGLEASKNRWVLGNAAYAMQSEYNAKLQRGETDVLAKQFAERYFLRAKAIDPKLDRAAILPQIDMEAIARDQLSREKESIEAVARAKAGYAKIRRLKADAFPQLPAAVAGVLRARGCTVPQPSPVGPARNVIRGQFFQKGESGWALFCSVGSKTSLLVFRNDRDTQPVTLRVSEGEAYGVELGDGGFGYSNDLSVAQPADMLRRNRIMGGPRPQPLDHQGVEDGILDKASSVWYFHQGKWLQLPGAD